MRSRNLIILAAVVVAVGAFIFFVERHQPTSDELRERADRVFPRLAADDVESVELRLAAGDVRLERVDDEWRLVAPLDDPADGGAVRMLIEAIAGLDAERVLTDDEVDPADYGLDDPRLGVVLVDADGRRFELEVGDETPLGSNRAVRRGGDAEIVLCPGSFVSSLDRGIDGWRSRDVVDLLENDLESIEITTAEDRISADRVDGRWWLSEPVADLADPEQMRSVVSELNGLRVREFLDTDGDGPDISAPDYRLELTPEGDVAPTVIELVDDDPDDKTMICRRDGADLFRVPDGIRARLDKAPVLWRSSKVWPLSTWDIAKVELAAGGDSIVLDRVDGLWQLSDGGEADQAEVRRRLNALADLEALDHDLVLPPTEVLGSVILVLDTEGGAEGLTYTFYRPIDEGGHAALAISSRRTVVGVDAALAETILGDLDALGATADGGESADG